MEKLIYDQGNSTNKGCNAKTYLSAIAIKALPLGIMLTIGALLKMMHYK